MIEILEKWISERDEEEVSVEKLNCIVVGKTGVGKSTLINAILGEKKAEIGQGQRGTQDLTMLLEESIPYTTEGSSFAFFDTMGLELENREGGLQGIINKSSMEKVALAIRKKIVALRKNRDVKQYIHCVFYCINAMSDRLEEAEIDLMKQIAQEGVQVYPVLTKVQDKQSITALIQRFQNLAGFEPMLTRTIDIYDSEGNALPNPYSVSLMVDEILENKAGIIYLANKNAHIANWEEDKKRALKVFEKETKNVDAASFISAMNAANRLLGISALKDEVEAVSERFYHDFQEEVAINFDGNSDLLKTTKVGLSGIAGQKIDDSRLKRAEKLGKEGFVKSQSSKGKAINPPREKAAGTIARKKLDEKIKTGKKTGNIKEVAIDIVVSLAVEKGVEFVAKGADKVLEKQHFRTNFKNAGLQYLNEIEKVQKEFYTLGEMNGD